MKVFRTIVQNNINEFFANDNERKNIIFHQELNILSILLSIYCTIWTLFHKFSVFFGTLTLKIYYNEKTFQKRHLVYYVCVRKLKLKKKRIHCFFTTSVISVQASGYFKTTFTSWLWVLFQQRDLKKLYVFIWTKY